MFFPSVESSRERRTVVLCVGYVVLHTMAHLSAFCFEAEGGAAASIWYPPVGLALALMVMLGPRIAWLVFLANFATAWIGPPPHLLWPNLFFPALITLCYGGAAWAVRRWHGRPLLPGAGRSTPVFCLVVGVLPLVPALVSTAVIQATGLGDHALTAREFAHAVFDWWLGDASGLLVVTPAAMVFVAPWLEEGHRAARHRARTRREIGWAVTRWVVLTLSLLVVVAVPVLREHSAFYLCFLPLIWIASRHGLRGATLATVLTMIVGLVGMTIAETTRDFSYIYLLFEAAVAVVGLGLGTLVTRREEAERELAANRERLHRMIDGARLGVWERELATGRMEGNARLTEMIGHRIEELEPLGEKLPALLHPDDRRTASEAWRAHLEGRRELFEAEVRMKAKDGHWRWIESRGSIVTRDGAGRPLRIAGTQEDVTARKHAEQAAARLSGIVEASPDFILTTDESGRVIYANAALLAWRGRGPWPSEEDGPMLEELVPAETAARWRAEAIPAALAEGFWLGEGTLTDGTGRALATSQAAVATRDPATQEAAISFVLRDISDQKRAEEERRLRDRELQQLQKSESLGVLAGGIAHDFNNLLTSIVGNANLARLGLAPGAKSLGYLDNVERAAGRAARLCQQMLAYAGRNPVAFAEIDLRLLVRDVWRLIESSINPRVRVDIEDGGEVAPILAADTQMQQVAMNLIINAAEAIGERGGGVAVRIRSEYLDTARASELFPGRAPVPGPYTLLEVEDDGAGMAPEVQARIFEPFFTTKFTGQGLGLAAVAGVVKSHRGHIAVKSEPGRGTLFRLAFPAVAARGEAADAATAEPPAARGAGLVLLVDDDTLIREVGAGILEAMGFSVLLAGDGAEGVECFRRHESLLKAVLLDLTMPRMDGFEAHAEMHRINPRVPVVLMSGFSSKLENLPPEAIHPAGVLPKPFGMEQLRERLAAVMDE